MKNLKSKLTALVIACSFTGIHAEFITTKSETLKVWMNPITAVADGQSIVKLTVYENDVKNYSAFNMALTVPEGVKIAKIKQGRETVDDIFLTDRAASTHTIACNMLEDNRTIKIISYSINVDEYFNDDLDGNPLDALFTLGLVVEPTVEIGQYVIDLFDVKFVDVNADASILPQEPLTTTLTVVSDPISIISVETESSETADEVYDLLGRRLSLPARGINIINGRKVIGK